MSPLSLLLLAACGDDTTSEERPPPPTPCVELATVEGAIALDRPVDGNYVGDTIALIGDPIDPVLQLELDGEAVPGSWIETGIGRWEFSPTDRLLPATTYAWSAQAEDWCDAVQGTYATSDIGLPVQDPEALVGRTFDVVVGRSPEGSSNWLNWALIGFIDGEDPTYMVRFDTLDGGVAGVTLAPRVAPGFVDVTQDPCLPITEWVGSWVEGARLQFQGDRLDLPIGHANGDVSYSGWGVTPPSVLELMDWNLELVIHPDGTAATLDHLSFTVDTRTLGDFGRFSDFGFEPGDGTPENFCRMSEELLTPFVGPNEPPLFACEACADGLETCVSSEFYGAGSVGYEVSRLVDLSEAQRENHLCETCDNGIDDDEDGEVDVDPECDETGWPPPV